MSELFANAPLVHATLEARFPGDITVEVARAEIQHEIRSSLPKLYVPRAEVGVAPAIQPYVFRSDDESESLEIAVNRVSYVTTKYGGYAVFKREALRYIGLFHRHVPEVMKLNRVGLRYVNHIPILRESPNASLPLQQYVNVGLTLPESVTQANLTELNSVFSVALDGGTLRVVLKNEPAKSELEPELLVLDLDFSQQNEPTISRMAEYLDLAHLHTKQVFGDLVSDKYLPVMRADNE